MGKKIWFRPNLVALCVSSQVIYYAPRTFSPHPPFCFFLLNLPQSHSVYWMCDHVFVLCVYVCDNVSQEFIYLGKKKKKSWSFVWFLFPPRPNFWKMYPNPADVVWEKGKKYTESVSHQSVFSNMQLHLLKVQGNLKNPTFRYRKFKRKFGGLWNALTCVILVESCQCFSFFYCLIKALNCNWTDSVVHHNKWFLCFIWAWWCHLSPPLAT